MAKRKTSSNRSKSKGKKRKNQGPTWRMWLVAWLIIVVFVGSLIWLKHLHPSSNKTGEKLAKELKNHTIPPAKPKQAPPKFEFYTLLPSNKERIPSATPLNSQAKPAAPVESLTNPPPVEQLTLLQVTSFKRYQDADNLKARLLLQGFNTNIEKSVQGQTTWYRVLVGPYADNAALTKAQAQLKAMHFDAIKATITVAKPAPLPAVKRG